VRKLGYFVAALGAAFGITAFAVIAEDAGSYVVPPDETYTVPDTSVQITNNSPPGSGAVFVEWDDNSENIRVFVDFNTATTIATAGTAVTVTANGSNPSVTTTGGNVTLVFDAAATDGVATLDGDGNSVAYRLGSSGNYATCNGDNNRHTCETDPDAVSGNETTFEGDNNDAR